MGAKILRARDRISQDLFEQLDLLIVETLRMPYSDVLRLPIDNWCEYVAKAEYVLNTYRSISSPMVAQNGKVTMIPMTLQIDLAECFRVPSVVPEQAKQVEQSKEEFLKDIERLYSTPTPRAPDNIPGVYKRSGTVG